MLFGKKIKEYKKKNEIETKKKRAKQFVNMFHSVTRELRLSGRPQNELNKIFQGIGNTEDSSDVFIKIILILHSVGGIGLSVLQNTPSSSLEVLPRLDLLSIYDLLGDSWVNVTEMIEGHDKNILAEPLLLYKSILSYISILHIARQRSDPKTNYYRRLDGSLGPDIELNVNRIDDETFKQDDDPNDELYMASEDA